MKVSKTYLIKIGINLKELNIKYIVKFNYKNLN